MQESGRGFVMGVLAYLMWGLFPLYWPLLEPAGSGEILAHRILWSSLSMAALVLLVRRTALLALLRDRRVLRWLALAAAVVSVNWLTYIWGVTNGRVVETSLGYFINPLVTVLLAVLFMNERLRPPQWGAILVGGLAVAVLTWDYGHLPWVALVLAFSFGTYGLAKKSANSGAVETLAIETLLVAPFAAAYLLWLALNGESNFVNHGAGHTALFVSTGIVTAIPLICFGAAATKVSMVTLGLLQYLAPIFQFALGVLWFGEEMPLGRWIGFCLIWVALGIFTYESWSHRRRQLALVAEASAA